MFAQTQIYLFENFELLKILSSDRSIDIQNNLVAPHTGIFQTLESRDHGGLLTVKGYGLRGPG